MIPKIIHYCWLSGEPYPENIQRCIDSWKRVLPDYEIVLWDTKRFDLSSSPWVKQAFESKKYAFAADYIRMYALYNYGGIYLDSDVEVLKPFDDLLYLPYFIGQENTPSGIEAATIGSNKGWLVAKLMLDRYDRINFRGKEGHLDLRSLPYMLRRCIEFNYRYNLIVDKSQFDYDPGVVNVFSTEFFSPKAWNTGKITVTTNTYSIHHFAASWLSNSIKKRDRKTKIKEKVAKLYRKIGSLTCRNVALLSNRSIAIHYYSFFYQDPCTPLLNTKIFGEDFNRLLDIIKTNGQLFLRLIPQYQSKHPAAGYDFYPVGVVIDTDIEVHFIHSLTKEEALRDWERGLRRMKGKRLVVAYVVMDAEDEELFEKVTFPKFKITSLDKGLDNLNQENCDSYFWKRLSVMKMIRNKIKCALRNK